MSPTSNYQPLVEDCFDANQRSFPETELAKYYGKQVAWSRDGSSIVASGSTWEELLAEIRTRGIDPFKVVYDYVPIPGESQLGWV